MGGPIPVVISLDVEPHGFDLNKDSSRSTAGYDAMVDVITKLRPALERATGRPPSFGWFFRMDPQIAGAFGTADHLAAGFDRRAFRLLDAGDHVGLHSHLLRWADSHGWVHDLTDADWVREVHRSSFRAFEECFGFRCERHRSGGALFSQAVVDSLQQAGALVESALEPVRDAAPGRRDVVTTVDASRLLGDSSDCAAAPRRAYRPAPGDFRRAGTQSTGLAMLPITTSWLRPNRPGWRTAAAAMKEGGRPPVRPLYVSRGGSPAEYWDLVARQLRLMRRPYANLAIRTDDPSSSPAARARAVLDALAKHPLAQKIAVVDPLEALPHLLGETPSDGGDGASCGDLPVERGDQWNQ